MFTMVVPVLLTANQRSSVDNVIRMPSLDFRGGEKGATLGSRGGPFSSNLMMLERSSRPRVRCAAPNDGAPLTDDDPF